MNSKQKLVSKIGLVIIFILIIYPPWISVHRYEGMHLIGYGPVGGGKDKNIGKSEVYPIGYGFLFMPPKDISPGFGYVDSDGSKVTAIAEGTSKEMQHTWGVTYSKQIDFGKLATPLIIVIVISLGLIMYFRDKIVNVENVNGSTDENKSLIK
jgi:hypothetical protein